MPQRIEVTVPDIGDFKDVEVIDVLVKPGDIVAAEAPLITLETEKATMDVPSTSAGRVTEVVVTKGDRVSRGSRVVVLEADAGAPAAVAAPPIEPVSPAAAVSQSATLVQEARAVEVRVPDLGDFKDVEVIDVLVKPGDPVAVDAPLATLETEKATMEVPSNAAGVVQHVHLAKGARVSAGDLVITLLAAVVPAAAATPTVGVAPAARPVVPVPAAAPPVAAPRIELAGGKLPPIEEAGFSRAHAGPSVRRLARELGVDLGRVTGTGVKGRVSHDDVKAYVKQALAQPAGAGLPRVPEVDYAAFGPVEVRPLGRIQRIAGARLHASWVNLPHVTQFDQADITDLEQLRAQLKQKALDLGIKLTPLAFLVRAAVRALAKFPEFCASLDAAGQNLVYRKYCHIGFAADTPNGLVVPVIRDADRKDIYEIARDLGVLSEKARAGKLPAADMQGGCFTISSLGGIGGTAFTPIINAPEVAILGVSRSQLQPVWRDTQFVPRLLLPLSLSYDHRVIDGAAAARFTTFLAETLAQPGTLTEAVP